MHYLKLYIVFQPSQISSYFCIPDLTHIDNVREMLSSFRLKWRHIQVVFKHLRPAFCSETMEGGRATAMTRRKRITRCCHGVTSRQIILTVLPVPRPVDALIISGLSKVEGTERIDR